MNEKKRIVPDREAIKRGFDFEDRVANILSLKKTPGSGNKFFAQGDCVGNNLLASCKSEINFTWAKIRRHLDESIEMAQGSGNIPILALQDVSNGSEEIVVIRLSDLAKAFENEVTIEKSFTSKGLKKRASADIPIMLRELEG